MFGTNLTVIKNTSLGFITGQFTNLTQGQAVSLSYNNATYRYVANYYGGSGRDLVLAWTANPFGVGYNADGELGTGAVTATSVLTAAKYSPGLPPDSIVAISTGSVHSVALTANGVVLTWGANDSGQLGLGYLPPTTPSTGPTFINGTFTNLAQGQAVTLTYNGVTYNYVANYYGGTGNDLVGMNPNVPGTMPGAASIDGATLSFTYTPSADAVAQGVTFTVEYSYTLAPGSWSSDIVNQGNIGSGGAPVTAPASGPCFFRLKVSSPSGGN